MRVSASSWRGIGGDFPGLVSLAIAVILRAEASPADAVIATDWFCEMVRPVVFRGQRVRLPEPTRNAGHIIFHSEIFHGLYTLNKVQLRHVIDLALLRARHEKAIDWDELDRRFSAADAGEALATYLHLASELLGHAAPQLSHAPRSDAMTELRSTESRNGFHFQIERLQSTCDGLLTHSSFLHSERDRLQSECDRLLAHSSLIECELENARSALAAISTSLSWRLTAPLRGIANTTRTLWRGLLAAGRTTGVR